MDAQLQHTPHFPTAPRDAPRAPWAAARIALAGMTAVVIANLIAVVVTFATYEKVIVDAQAGAVDPGTALAVVMVLVLVVVAWIFSGIAFIVWLFRARRNLDRLGAEADRSIGWTIGSWFIPLANLVLPYRVVTDVHESSIPYVPGQPDAVRRAPVGAWWAAWVAFVILDRISGLGGSPETLEELHAARTTMYAMTVAESVALIAAAVLGALVVLRITRAQEQLAALR